MNEQPQVEPPLIVTHAAGHPIHHGSVTTIAGDEVLVTGDCFGRILRWTSEGGRWIPHIWRSHGRRIDSLTTRGGAIGWIEDEFLWAGRSDAPESGTKICLMQHCIGLRWADDESTLYCATNGGVVLAFSHTDEPTDEPPGSSADPQTQVRCEPGWTVRTMDAETRRFTDKHQRWTYMYSAQIRSDASAVFHGKEDHKSEVVLLSVPTEGILRTTKVFQHLWPTWNDKLLALDVGNGRLTEVSAKSDRGKTRVELPPSRSTPPKPWTLVGTSVLCDERRLLATAYHARYGDLPGTLAVIDLRSNTVRHTVAPDDGSSTTVAFAGDDLFIRTLSGTRRTSLAGTELELEMLLEPSSVLRPTVLARGSCYSHVREADALYVILGTELMRFDFSTRELSTVGPSPDWKGRVNAMRVVEDEDGQLLVLSGPAVGLAAYDLPSGAQLWTRDLADGLRVQDDDRSPRWLMLGEGEGGYRAFDARRNQWLEGEQVGFVPSPAYEVRVSADDKCVVDRSGAPRAHFKTKWGETHRWTVSPDGALLVGAGDSLVVFALDCID